MSGEERRVRLLRLVAPLLLLHNIEEAIAMPEVLPRVQARLAAALPGAPAVSHGEFVAALVLVTAPPFLVAVLGDLRRKGGAASYFLLLVQAVLLLNAASHVAAAIALRGYAPGLATALAVNLPFALLLLRLAWRERWHGRGALVALAPLALVVHGPLLVALLWVVGRWGR